MKKCVGFLRQVIVQRMTAADQDVSLHPWQLGGEPLGEFDREVPILAAL